MVALWNRADHYNFALWFLLSFFLLFSRLISAVADWMSAIHGVALVRISDAGLKRAARGSLKIQDAKKSPKIVMRAPSHNFGLYLHN